MTATATHHPRPAAIGNSRESSTNPTAVRMREQSIPTPGPPPGRGPTAVPPPSQADEELVRSGLPAERAATVRSPFLPNVPLTADPLWHLARRLAPGATTAVVAEIRAAGRAAWLNKQLAPGTINDSACAALIAKLPAATMTANQAVLHYYTYNTGWKIAPTVIRATLLRRVFSKRYLLESMVEFWHDQLHVMAEADAPAYWIGDYDTYVIRKHALGKFATLLYAATTHGAMLDYLDNSSSTKDDPNENLGREFLELHTMGVGNFTEDDVKAMTLLLTGWFGDWGSMTGRFDPGNHHVGPITVAGVSHANSTPDAGPAALAYIAGRIARSRATATRICARLAVRFVSDTPPQALVDRLVGVYLANDTAIVPVLRTLFNSAEFAASTGRKWRRPSESLVTSLRAARPTLKPIDSAAVKDNPYNLMGTECWLLDIAGHTPLNWPGPDGYPDVSTRWMHTNGMLTAWNMAEAHGGRWEESLTWKAWTQSLAIAATMTPGAIAAKLYLSLTGFAADAGAKNQMTRFLWSGDPAGDLPPTTTTPIGADRLSWYLGEAVRIVFASPYFQIR